MTDRDTYASNLRNLADLIPELPLPNQIQPSRITFYVQDSHDTIWSITDLMIDVTLERDRSVDFPLTINGTLAGFPTVVRVCTRLALAEGQMVSAPELNPRLAVLCDDAGVKAAS